MKHLKEKFNTCLLHIILHCITQCHLVCLPDFRKSYKDVPIYRHVLAGNREDA